MCKINFSNHVTSGEKINYSMWHISPNNMPQFLKKKKLRGHSIRPMNFGWVHLEHYLFNLHFSNNFKKWAVHLSSNARLHRINNGISITVGVGIKKLTKIIHQCSLDIMFLILPYTTAIIQTLDFISLFSNVGSLMEKSRISISLFQPRDLSPLSPIRFLIR